MHVRPPAVAGTFYEGTEDRLRKQLDACFAANPPAAAKQQFIGAVTPHAGLMYSGHVAAALYAILDLPERLVILSPNHTGYGKNAAIDLEGEWLTPLGRAPIDHELAQELCAEAPELEDDRTAHSREHSLEVQLPFLQMLDPGMRFVPICIKRHDYTFCESIGEAIARVIARHRDAGERIAILASSDMNHYEGQTTTLEKDQLAIDRVLDLDPSGLYDTVRLHQISMCGILPTTTMLVAANRLGATEAKLVKHATSGDITHDYSAVVGYASMLVS